MRKRRRGARSEDKKKRELAELRNQAESMCFQLEKLMKEHADKLSDADKAPLEAAIKKTRDVAKGSRRRGDQVRHQRAGARLARLQQDALRERREAPAPAQPGAQPGANGKQGGRRRDASTPSSK